MLSFASYGVKTDGSRNLLQYNLKLIDVKQADMNFCYNINYENQLWGKDQCAFCIASKEIASSKGRQTLVFVIIRGTPLSADEWISNINLSDESKTEKEIHEGFYKATEQVYTELISFMLKKRIDPTNAFLLITGHSRGGAVSNLLAYKCSSDGFFQRENIYAYTFAAPNVTTLDTVENAEYDFIWNIVNAEDIVPTVPMFRGKWSYRKFGHMLTFCNYWNTDQENFDNIILPKVDEVFTKLANRNYSTFKMGPFIPIQTTAVLNNLNGSIEKYYSGSGLHHKISNLLSKIFTAPAVVNNKAEKEEIETKHKSIKDRIINWINNRTDGLYDKVEHCFSDMHSIKTYFSFMNALDENQAFSTLGCSQIVIHGREEGAIIDKDGNRLLLITEGRIDYTTIKSPLAARSMFGDSVVVGIPANIDFDFVLTNESILPTPISLTIEHFDSTGRYLGSSKKIPAACKINSVYQFEAGTTTLDAEDIDFKKIRGIEAKQIITQNSMTPLQEFHVMPEISLNTDLNLSFGARIGSTRLYGVALLGFPLEHPGESFELSLGIGNQNTLIGPITLSGEFIPKMIWVYEPQGSDENIFNLVPEIRLSLSIRPVRTLSLFMAGTFDFEIDGFNNAAFKSDVRTMNMGSFPLGSSVNVAPSIQFGIQLQLGNSITILQPLKMLLQSKKTTEN